MEPRAMGFDQRYENEIDDDASLANLLATRYRLEMPEALALLQRARRASADDEYRRPVAAWCDLLARRDGASRSSKPSRHGDTPDLVPGRRTHTRTEATRLADRQAFLARMQA